MNESATRVLNEQQQQAMSAADAVIQGAARILEIQATAARTFLENQGRTTSMFGAPELSSLLKPAGPITDLFNVSTQQATAFMRQTSETMTEVQRQMSQLIEAQTKWMTEQMRKNMDEFTRQTGESLKLWRDATRQADQAEGTAQSGEQAMQSGNATPAIVVSGGLEGTRSAQPRPEERGKATAKR